MSIFSHFLGLDAKAPARSAPLDALLKQLQDPSYGQDELQKTTQATVQNALPDFMRNLQGTREDSIRRGISTGDLGSSFEGDLTSAFQRNIANSVAAQSASMMGQWNNLLFGGLSDDVDREQGAQNAAGQRKSSFLNGLISTVGSVIGAKMGAKN